jgi:uncharacterized protein (DUF433 family)
MRIIMRDSNILDGRWHFQGTSIPIADVRNDFRSSSPAEQRDYAFPSLSHQEIQEALSFDFPVVRGTEVDVLYASVVVHCECGEDTPQASSWPVSVVDCVCKREWRITISIEPVPSGTKAAHAA